MRPPPMVAYAHMPPKMSATRRIAGTSTAPSATSACSPQPTEKPQRQRSMPLATNMSSATTAPATIPHHDGTPSGVARRPCTGAILARIEAKGYSLVDIKLVEPSRELLARHYAEHEGKPFYEPLLEFMMSGPVVAIRVAGNRVIEGFRSLAGATDPTTAAPGTIRGDYGRDWGVAVQQNLVHGSDSPESAASELDIWF